MKRINIPALRSVAVVFFAFGLMSMAVSQATMPDVLYKSSLNDQMNYIQEKTKIYEDYRAIREDIFQQIKRNSLDSLQAARVEISSLKMITASRNRTIDSLNSSLESNGKKLEEVISSKNSFQLFGIEINKRTYNAIMWLTIAILSGILVSGLLSFKRNHIVTINTKKEFEDLKKEFEAYRKASREAREKMSMAHFNEMKKIRTG